MLWGKTLFLGYRDMLAEKTKREIFRFVITGVLATGIHYGIYYALLNFINTSIAFTIGYFLSFIFNYYMSARFTFQKKTSAKNGVGFLGAHLFNYLLQVSLLNIFIYLGVPKAFAPFPVYAISIPVNFIVVRFVFSRK